MATKGNRCWPGYEPVKGKRKNEQGSCRPKAKSKTTTTEKEFRAKRKEQLDAWQKEHNGTRRSASQHLHRPGTRTKTSARKKSAAAKRTSSNQAA